MMRLSNKLILAILGFGYLSVSHAFEIRVSQGHSPRPTAKPVEAVRWAPYRGVIPRRAISGGYENGHNLAICRTRYRGGIHPGKVVSGNCNITYAGREISQANFRILVGKQRQLHWADAIPGRVPRTAVVGGFERGHPLYICHGRYFGGVHPGKVVQGNCNIGYGGREIYLRNYQILAQN